jgi:hypothetical protein
VLNSWDVAALVSPPNKIRRLVTLGSLVEMRFCFGRDDDRAALSP